jgi:hypothetical protein
LTGITVQTSPAGLSFTVDGTTYTSAQIFQWVPGSPHQISTSSPQAGGPGTQYAFNNWSDGGAISHSIASAPASATIYTATFDTQYQLTTSVAPPGSGTVTPASGSFFSANVPVSLQAVANPGNAFVNWTGPVAAANSASTTVTLTAPTSVMANFQAGGTSMAARISGRVGPSNARLWTISLTNNGPGAANSAQIDGFGLTQTSGAACTPVITSPAAFPLAVGSIAPSGTGSGTITIDFTGCAATARFKLVSPFSANGGTAGGVLTLFNLFQ